MEQDVLAEGGYDQLSVQVSRFPADEGRKGTRADLPRLFLELSRLMASDREAASYRVKGSDLD